ncbi:acid-sensing ion channel 4-A [Trichonephila clavipes]|nr:acid-sensing ion channel 4-A [Trichonephila clavipes]
MSSSIHAVSHITSSTATISKLFWLLVLIVGIIGSCYKGYKFFYLYFLYPTVFTLSIKHEQNLKFPAVSICNLNRLKLRLEVGSPPVDPENEGTPLLFSERQNLFNCKNGQNISWNEKSKAERDILIEYYEMNETARFEEGHHPSDFMTKCFFNGRFCPQNRITFFQNIRYGNCITFNGRKKEMEPLTISDIGYNTGLILELDLETLFYQEYSKTAGARVIIHDPHETPAPEDHGFNVSPGYEVSVSLRQSVIVRLPAPFRDRCVDYLTREGSSVTNQKDCVRTCIQTEIFLKCGCIDQTLNVRNDINPCNLINGTQMCCLDETLKEMAAYGPPCDCPQPCESISYNEVLSTAVWPSKAWFSKNSYIFNYYRNEKLRLNIFFSNLETSVFKQKPKFEGFELINYLGCELGLWLGLSLLSVFEIVEKAPLIVKCKAL